MIGARLSQVRSDIEAACRACGRDPAEVGLVAVSKTKPSADIREAFAWGQRDFGENYAQELRDKGGDLTDLAGVRWHFIGRLQSNKAKYVAPLAWRVHALESRAQAEALVARAPGPLSALLAVHLGAEDTKGGVHPSQVPVLLRDLASVSGLEVVGLMTLPPFCEHPEDTAPFFAELADLAARARADGFPVRELSMGMSHDYAIAIRHGATWVRVGTAIFGAR
jgi:hypothetical protein